MQSRYYNPDMGRFINADSFVSTGQGVLGYNMYAYCGNNPISYSDPTGYRMVYKSIELHGNGLVSDSVSKRDTLKELSQAFIYNLEVSGGIGLGLLYENTWFELVGVGAGIYYNPFSVQFMDGRITVGQEFSQGIGASLFHHNFGRSESGYSAYGNKPYLEENIGFYGDDTLTISSGSYYFIAGGTFRIGFDIVNMLYDINRIFGI